MFDLRNKVFWTFALNGEHDNKPESSNTYPHVVPSPPEAGAFLDLLGVEAEAQEHLVAPVLHMQNPRSARSDIRRITWLEFCAAATCYALRNQVVDVGGLLLLGKQVALHRWRNNSRWRISVKIRPGFRDDAGTVASKVSMSLPIPVADLVCHY